ESVRTLSLVSALGTARRMEHECRFQRRQKQTIPRGPAQERTARTVGRFKHQGQPTERFACLGLVRRGGPGVRRASTRKRARARQLNGRRHRSGNKKKCQKQTSFVGIPCSATTEHSAANTGNPQAISILHK